MRIWVLNSRTATALQLHMCTKGQPWHIDSGAENHFCYDFLFTRNFDRNFCKYIDVHVLYTTKFCLYACRKAIGKMSYVISLTTVFLFACSGISFFAF